MAVTLEQLRTPVTQDQMLQTILDNLQAVGFNTSSWQAGSTQRDICEAMALIFSDLTESIDALSRLGFNESATGEALTEFSLSHYDNTRKLAQKTQGIVKLTDDAGVGPITFNPSDVVVGNEATPQQTFRNITGDTLPLNGDVTMTYEAEVGGAAGNVANGDIVRLITAIAGVSATNLDNAPGSATWRSQEGADAEPDPTLRTRNRTRWGLLSIAVPEDGYINLALGVVGVERAAVDGTNPRGPGTVDVYAAGPSGPASGAEVAEVQTAIGARRPVTADALALAAVALNQDFIGEVFVDTNKYDGPAGVLETAVKQAIDDFVNGLAIGGKVIPPGPPGKMLFSELIGAITAVDGVESVVLTTPSADVTLATFEVMVRLAFTLTFTPF